MVKVKFLKDIRKVAQMPEDEQARLLRVQDKYRFLATDYYLGLINWEDPYDPIRRIVVPTEEETLSWGRRDPSNEALSTVMPGVQHKYSDTALFLASEVCGGQCRFCFRKRLFVDKEKRETALNLPAALQYVRRHPEISNVLVTGGDALMLSTRRLTEIIEGLSAIDHVRAIRLGSKLPAYFPQRIINDRELLNLLERYNTGRQRIYVMSHFNHPRELTDVARASIGALLRTGAVVCNQTPIIQGVNDDVDVLVELMNELMACGAVPYYFFQCRPTTGNFPYAVPITRCYFLIEYAKYRVSGLARRVRYVMSHERGKIEVVGVTGKHIYVKYHRARDASREGKFLVFYRDDEAFWYDDLLAQRRDKSMIVTSSWQPHEADSGGVNLSRGHDSENASDGTGHPGIISQNTPSDN
ncbi:KamA family radical SAM protein [bacterium]|nr:KamA family radical SAM protein [bacterium]